VKPPFVNTNIEKLKESVAGINIWLKDVFEDLHQHPESGWQEYYTTGKIGSMLSEMAYPAKMEKPETHILHNPYFEEDQDCLLTGVLLQVVKPCIR